MVCRCPHVFICLAVVWRYELGWNFQLTRLCLPSRSRAVRSCSSASITAFQCLWLHDWLHGVAVFDPSYAQRCSLLSLRPSVTPLLQGAEIVSPIPFV